MLVLMIFFRLIYIVRVTISMTFYTDPRSQRVCHIYGTDANYNFAIKCIMKKDAMLVLLYSMSISLVALSYQLRLFERQINTNYDNITTAMWNMMVTMFTIGYGDIYPKSHFGRLIGIVIAFLGVYNTSLFIVALNNMLEFESPECKAFNLLQRIQFKDLLRVEAAGALGAAYKLKLTRK